MSSAARSRSTTPGPRCGRQTRPGVTIPRGPPGRPRPAPHSSATRGGMVPSHPRSRRRRCCRPAGSRRCPHRSPNRSPPPRPTNQVPGPADRRSFLPAHAPRCPPPGRGPRRRRTVVPRSSPRRRPDRDSVPPASRRARGHQLDATLPRRHRPSPRARPCDRCPCPRRHQLRPRRRRLLRRRSSRQPHRRLQRRPDPRRRRWLVRRPHRRSSRRRRRSTRCRCRCLAYGAACRCRRSQAGTCPSLRTAPRSRNSRHHAHRPAWSAVG